MKGISVGILTLYYNNPNYGALLQAYALQHKLEQMGIDAMQISYELSSGYPKKQKFREQAIKLFRSIKIKIAGGYYLCHRRVENEILKFQNYIPHTKPVKQKNIYKLNSNFDVFICGSDQIWNPIGWQPTLFLDFSTKPKIAYAASIAQDRLQNTEIQFIKRYTKDFIKISVREENSADILAENGVINSIQIMPDPTLLFNSYDWDMLLSLKEAKNAKKYIFAYFLGYDKEQRETCKQFASKQGLDIVFVPYLNKEAYEWDLQNKNNLIHEYTVNDFVSYIRNAALVVTDSYHGAVFSAIYGVPFYGFDRQSSYGIPSMNSRFKTLFNELGIDKRRFAPDLLSIEEFQFSDKEILIIRDNLDYMAKKGEQFLSDSIGLAMPDCQ